MPVRPPSRVTRQPKATHAPAGVPPEKAGPIEELTLFMNDGEVRGVLNTRFVFEDSELVSKNGPGRKVSWRYRDGESNPFWDSLNNRSDPQLLRAQARFLELSKGTRNSALRKDRAELLAQVEHRLTAGLDEFELDSRPRSVSLGVIKRLALAANVPLDRVRVIPASGRELPAFLRSPSQKVTSLAEWESRRGPGTLNRLGPTAPRMTADGARRRAELEREVATMTSWFEKNPRGTLDDYSREQVENERHIDHAFWGAMQDMMDRADLAELAGPGGVGGRGTAWFEAESVRPRRPASPSRGGGRPSSMTPLEMVSHPSFVDYLTAKSEGFRGSFADFVGR